MYVGLQIPPILSPLRAVTSASSLSILRGAKNLLLDPLVPVVHTATRHLHVLLNVLTAPLVKSLAFRLRLLTVPSIPISPAP